MSAWKPTIEADGAASVRETGHGGPAADARRPVRAGRLPRILANPQATLGLVLMGCCVACALLAPVIAPNDPNAIDVLQKFAPSSAQYPLGCDQLGRCELSRLIWGARNSLAISIPVIALLSLLALVVGGLSVVAHPRVQAVVTWACDVFMAFPAVVVAAALVGLLGNRMGVLVLAVLVSTWAWFVRVVRSYMMVEMGKPYALAARVGGCGQLRLVVRHLIPNIAPQYLVYVSCGIASCIVTVSGFAFLGIGFESGVAEWGAMMSDARGAIFSHPELLVYPGLCILATAGGFNLFGEALRDELERGEVR